MTSIIVARTGSREQAERFKAIIEKTPSYIDPEELDSIKLESLP